MDLPAEGFRSDLSFVACNAGGLLLTFFFLLSPCVNCTSRKQRKKLLYGCLLDVLVAFPTALLGSFSGAGLSALWPGGSTVAWLQDLSTAHQPSTHSAHPSSSASQGYPCWSLQQGETGCRGSGVSGSTFLPYDLTKRKVQGFLKAGCFLQGGEGVSLGGRVAEKKDRYEKGATTHQTYSVSQTGPFSPLGTLSVWINWFFWINSAPTNYLFHCTEPTVKEGGNCFFINKYTAAIFIACNFECHILHI